MRYEVMAVPHVPQAEPYVVCGAWTRRGAARLAARFNREHRARGGITELFTVRPAS